MKFWIVLLLTTTLALGAWNPIVSKVEMTNDGKYKASVNLGGQLSYTTDTLYWKTGDTLDVITNQEERVFEALKAQASANEPIRFTTYDTVDVPVYDTTFVEAFDTTTVTLYDTVTVKVSLTDDEITQRLAVQKDALELVHHNKLVAAKNSIRKQAQAQLQKMRTHDEVEFQRLVTLSTVNVEPKDDGPGFFERTFPDAYKNTAEFMSPYWGVIKWVLIGLGILMAIVFVMAIF